jgi:hypothetical protein
MREKIYETTPQVNRSFYFFDDKIIYVIRPPSQPYIKLAVENTPNFGKDELIDSNILRFRPYDRRISKCVHPKSFRRTLKFVLYLFYELIQARRRGRLFRRCVAAQVIFQQTDKFLDYGRRVITPLVVFGKGRKICRRMAQTNGDNIYVEAILHAGIGDIDDLVGDLDTGRVIRGGTGHCFWFP